MPTIGAFRACPPGVPAGVKPNPGSEPKNVLDVVGKMKTPPSLPTRS
jgi:hypothetical protein